MNRWMSFTDEELILIEMALVNGRYSKKRAELYNEIMAEQSRRGVVHMPPHENLYMKLMPKRYEWAGVIFLMIIAVVLLAIDGVPTSTIQGLAKAVLVLWFGIAGLALQRRPV